MRETKYDAVSTSQSPSSPRSAARLEHAAARRCRPGSRAGGDVDDAVVAVAEVVDRRRSAVGHVRDLERLDERITTCSCSDVVVLDVRAQRQRRRLAAGVQEDGGAGRAVDGRVAWRASRSTKSCSGPSSSRRLRGDDLAAPLPGRQDVNTHERDRAAGTSRRAGLGRLAAKKARSTIRNAAAPASTSHSGLCQSDAHDDEEQDRVDRERAGDRDAVGRRQAASRSRSRRRARRRRRRAPVDGRHVDLADLVRARCAGSSGAAGSRAARPGG